MQQDRSGSRQTCVCLTAIQSILQLHIRDLILQGSCAREHWAPATL